MKTWWSFILFSSSAPLTRVLIGRENKQMRKLSLTLLAAVTALAFNIPAAGAQDTLTVATAGPMTGQYDSFGEPMKRGTEIAVADFNAAGAVRGKQLVLALAAETCNPK